MLTVAALADALAPPATPAQKTAAEAYFKGAVPFLGVKGPAVDGVARAARPAFRALAAPDRLALALALLDEPPFELRHLGVLFLHHERRVLPAGWLAGAEPVLRRRATNWGTADDMAGKVLRYRVEDAADRAFVVGWAAADSPWLRRMACVSFLAAARRGAHAAEIDTVVRGALALDHRFAQLGAGWLLRERWLAAPAEVEAFLEGARGRMRREALRYALEKMPAERRAALLAG
jgi:3-methyladenine DNA glycosylase AlkD